MTNYPNPGEEVLCQIVDSNNWDMMIFTHHFLTKVPIWQHHGMYTPIGCVKAWYRPDELIQHVGHLTQQLRDAHNAMELAESEAARWKQVANRLAEEGGPYCLCCPLVDTDCHYNDDASCTELLMTWAKGEESNG